jgi:uncharacterized membrane protein YcjF (UPF0283 family)
MAENELHELLQEHEMTDQAELDKLTERVNDMIEKKSRQVRRMRRVVAIAWTLFACLLFAGGFIEIFRGRSGTTQVMAFVAQGVVLIAIVLTVSWYVRSVDMRFLRVQAALSTIQDGLDALLRRSTDNPQD